MTAAPNGERLHIAIVGPRNAGKSSLINRLAGRDVAIVSPVPGTTTDPVRRPMELGALGPVVLEDTAGLDDSGELGDLRVERSRESLSSADIVLVVAPLDREPLACETLTIAGIRSSGKPWMLVGSFADVAPDAARLVWFNALEAEVASRAAGAPAAIIRLDNKSARGVGDLLAALIRLSGRGLEERTPLDGLVRAGDLVVLVTPIDSAAPKGRMILPQMETLRDALDRGCHALTLRETELASGLALLRASPHLVVTDSQAFASVAAVLPAGQALTSFSILFARKKAQLGPLVQALSALDALAAHGVAGGPPPRILILEACTHHRTEDDIGTQKIPRIIRERIDERAEFSFVRGQPKADQLAGYDLAIACGACMTTRGATLAMQARLATAGLALTNYGVFLAWASGLIPRALEPLPEFHEKAIAVSRGAL